MNKSRRWLLFLFAAYFLGLHAVVVAALLYTDMISRASARLGISLGKEVPLDVRAYRSALAIFERIDQTTQKSPVIFFGDSLVADLPPFPELSRPLNLGVAGSRTLDIVNMLGRYRYLDQAAGLVLGIGINDLCGERASPRELALRLRKLSAALPSDIPVVWSSILPVDPNSGHSRCIVPPETIREANAFVKELCAERKACAYSDGFSKLADATGYLSTQFHVGDGLHLNSEGYRLWSDQLRRDLQRSGAYSR